MFEIISFLPITITIIPILGSILIAVFGKEKGLFRENTCIASVTITLFISIYTIHRTFFMAGKAIIYTAFNRIIFIDGFSSMMALLINVMVLLAAIYSLRYMRSQVDEGRIKDSNLRLYYSLITLFDGTLCLTVISNNLIMLFISMEASTLATAMLVSFFRDRRSLEAGYKYVVLVVVGMSFALMGCVLLFSSAVPHLTGHNALLLTEIGKIANVIPRNIALICVACFIIGFGAKAGIIPFHAWLPDAHSEAPTPVSALLSGLIIKLGAYALARTVTIFSPHYHIITVYIAALGCISMVIGILLAFAQDDFKRLLAFSSISQISYVFEGLGLGSYTGIFGGLFHLINHTILKTLLFLSAGALMYATGTRKISELGGLSRKMPITAVCFFIGALGISGMPPFNGFQSKFTIFIALARQDLWWAVAISILTGILTLAVFIWAGCRIFWGQAVVPQATAASTDKFSASSLLEIPFTMWAPMVILAGFVLLIGIYPQILYPVLDSATKSIIHIWKGVGF